MRKLATIRVIDALTPIEGADKIEVATVGGWKVVCQKGLYQVGGVAIYCEIDSWMPFEVAPFLTKGKEPREFEGVKGERLKTIRLRGQLSQGLLLPYTEFPAVVHAFHQTRLATDEDFDVTEILGIKKWEKPINAQLAGVCKGNFPTLIPKTDQERCQNMKKEITSAAEAAMRFEVTEKLEGSSMTVYLLRGEFGVCSRNMDLKETEGNSFWATARKEDIEAKMRAVDEHWDFAIQGELIGPGIQGNIYKLSQPEFRVFDVYNIQGGTYLEPAKRRELIARMGLNHAPVLEEMVVLDSDIEELLDFAEGKSVLGDTEREGIVFKECNGGMSFKAISNKYLLGEK